MLAAAKGRPVSLDQLEALAGEVEEGLRLEGGGDVASERIGLAVLDRLRVLDEVTYVRFASVYKSFDEADDFARELTLLAQEHRAEALLPRPRRLSPVAKEQRAVFLEDVHERHAGERGSVAVGDPR